MKRTKKVKASLKGNHTHGFYWDFPATAEAYDAMVEQAAAGIMRCWPGAVMEETWKREARAALRAIGIRRPAK